MYILEAINRGVQLALDDYTEQDNDVVIPKRATIKNDNGIAKNVQWIKNNFVDLGLPSGTIWAKYNLGCNWDKLYKEPENSVKEDWYGAYYAWGELKPKRTYRWWTYEFGTQFKLSKYLYKQGEQQAPSLQLEDDAAYQTDPRMQIPSSEQCKELIKHTKKCWEKNYMGLGVSGMRFIGKNDQEIFIPAAGIMEDSSLQDAGADGTIQTSTLFIVDLYSNDSYECANLFFDYGGAYNGGNNRCKGIPIRPVLVKE